MLVHQRVFESIELTSTDLWLIHIGQTQTPDIMNPEERAHHIHNAQDHRDRNAPSPRQRAPEMEISGASGIASTWSLGRLMLLTWALPICWSPWKVGKVWTSWKIASGKLTKSYGKSPFSMGKLTISMVIFNSYVTNCQRVAQTTNQKGGCWRLHDFSPEFHIARSMIFPKTNLPCWCFQVVGLKTTSGFVWK